VDPPVTGVEGGRWHGVERVYPPRAADTGECGRALCGALVRVAVRVGVFDPDRVPGPTCLECGWRAALAAGTVPDRVRALSADEGASGLAARVAEAVVAEASGSYGYFDLGHPYTVQLLVAVSAHAPAAVVAADCVDGDCEHAGQRSCPRVGLVCLGCSELTGSWDGEREGACLPEVTIGAPCEVLRALAAHYRVTGGGS